MSKAMKQARTQSNDRSTIDWWTYTGPLGVALVTLTILAFVLLAAIAGFSPSPVIWYLARAAGMTTYMLLWISVVSGLALSLRLTLSSIDQGILLTVHRFTADLSIVFVVLHLVSMAFDPTVPLGMLGVLLPFMSDIRQPWTDLGIISGYLLIGITASFGIRAYIGSQTWRRIHYLTFPLWCIALIHGIGAGTDSDALWAILMYLLTADAVLFLATIRLLTRRERRRKHAPERAVARASMTTAQD